MSCYYEWNCNRCDTRAADTSRHGVEMFAEHHVRTLHPLFTAEASKTRWEPKPKRRRIRSYRIAAP